MISALSKIHFKKFSNLYKKLLNKLYFPKLALFYVSAGQNTFLN